MVFNEFLYKDQQIYKVFQNMLPFVNKEIGEQILCELRKNTKINEMEKNIENLMTN
jgi:hypothetical protein